MTDISSETLSDATGARKSIMATLAASSPEAVAEKYETLTPPAFELVRQPETGLVMVRGRMGGTGSPFNLGEVTVTRCVVRLETGETGNSYSLGRNKQKALQSAVIDALSRTERSAHSSLRLRCLAMLRTNATVSFVILAAMCLPPSASGSLPPPTTGWAAPMLVPGAIDAT